MRWRRALPLCQRRSRAARTICLRRARPPMPSRRSRGRRVHGGPGFAEPYKAGDVACCRSVLHHGHAAPPAASRPAMTRRCPSRQRRTSTAAAATVLRGRPRCKDVRVPLDPVGRCSGPARWNRGCAGGRHLLRGARFVFAILAVVPTIPRLCPVGPVPPAGRTGTPRGAPRSSNAGPWFPSSALMRCLYEIKGNRISDASPAAESGLGLAIVEEIKRARRIRPA